MPKLKQATISSLKGVVIIEDFVRQKNLLDNQDESEENILDTLNYLKKKKPCKEVIQSTSIDATLQILCNHVNKIIADEAKTLLKCWDLDGTCKRQPTIEVRYDNVTRHIRRTATRLFRDTLGGSESDEKMGEVLEREIFHKSNRLISKSYRRTVRKIVFILKHHEDESIKLKGGNITTTQFVLKYLR